MYGMKAVGAGVRAGPWRQGWDLMAWRDFLRLWLPVVVLAALASIAIYLVERQSMERALTLVFAGVVLLATVTAGIVAYNNARRRGVEQSLLVSEARFRTLFEAAPDGILIADDQGRIVLANPQIETQFGYRREELLGQPLELLMPERYRRAHVGLRDGYIRAPRTRPMGEGLELYGRRKDGGEFPVSISLSPINLSASGGAVRPFVIGAVRDITSQREAERDIAQLNQRLERHNTELQAINQELEAFSYSVSHDLRAPLRAIDGFSQILLGENATQLDAQGRDRLERVRRAAQKMGNLIDDMLNLSRVTRAEVRMQAVDLGSLAEEVMDALGKQEPERVVGFTLGPGLVAQGDPKLLRVALDNLLGNAWKFTSRKADAHIEFGVNEQDGGPVYFIKDNGAGFDMAYADKLFGAFQRLHDTQEFPGTGIGLATVQRIVHKHGGRIWAEAAVDRGATFYFTLPPQEGR